MRIKRGRVPCKASDLVFARLHVYLQRVNPPHSVPMHLRLLLFAHVI